MITRRDANEELKGLEKKVQDGTITMSDIVKGISVLMKISLSTRINTVRIMEHLKIPLVESNKKTNEGTPKNGKK